MWWKIYCSSPRPDPDPQLGSRSRKVLGRQALQSMCKYNCETAISNCPLIYLHTWENGSSSFLSMCQLNCLSRTWEYFPSIPSMMRNNGENCFCCSCQCLPLLSFFLFPPSNKADHFLLTVGVIVGIPKYDVNDGVSLTFSEPPY